MRLTSAHTLESYKAAAPEREEYVAVFLQPPEKEVKEMVKTVLLLAAAGAALGAGVAYAGIGARDVYTDGASVLGPRDPYSDGGMSTKFDVYSDGARVTDRRDVFTDGARNTSRDGLVEGSM
ncbi:hypothetical protein [Cupriavidus basilensis]|uniref:hypothetical protein n=1 Tax=Cupriavidus basilensis TaxID=68895 RepID=UPI0030CA419A